jgi:DNA (cytosine-5)-methyltransferase 1
MVWGGLQEHQTPRKDGISPALTAAMGMGGGQTPIFAEKSVTAVDEQNIRIRTDTVGTLTTDGSTPKHNNRVLEIERSDCVAKIGQVSSEGSQCGSVYSDDGNMPTLTAGTHGDANSRICTEYRIRKLTPIECWRLMDFSDEDFHKAESVNSNTQLYKQAGNSIVVNVLVAILGQLFAGKEDVYKDCKVKREDTNFFEENV